MDTKISNGSYLGVQTIDFSCGGYEGRWTVDGANLIYLRHVPTDTSVLYTPETKEDLLTKRIFGIPLLLFPNRIAGGRFTFQGRRFQFPLNCKNTMHIHGILNGSTKWQVRTAEADTVTDTVRIIFHYLFDERDPAYSYFNYKIDMTYENIFTPEGLQQKFSFKNCSDCAMPFAFAYHTSFNIPFNTSPKDAFVFQANLKAEYELDNMLPTGRMLELDAVGTQSAGIGYPMRDTVLDNLYLADSSRPNCAVLTDTGTGTSVVYETDPLFKHWVLYTMDGRHNLLCVEPQTCCINAVNMDIPTANLLALQPQEEICLQTKLYVNNLPM